MAAMIRAGGPDFDPDEFLARSRIEATRVFRRGEPRFRRHPEGPFNEWSSLNIVASSADFDEYPRQIEEATRFLEDHRVDILPLVASPGVEGVTLDFGVLWEDVPLHCDVLPATLVRLAGELGLAIEISHYPVGDRLPTHPSTAGEPRPPP